jgi:splicing factor 3B subunit 5
MKYVGTGHADFTKWYIAKVISKLIMINREWGTNMQRDSLSSHLGHHSRMVYFGVAENQSVARMKYNFIMVSIEHRF